MQSTWGWDQLKREVIWIDNIHCGDAVPNLWYETTMKVIDIHGGVEPCRVSFLTKRVVACAHEDNGLHEKFT